MTTLGARNAKTRAACRAVGYVRRSTDRQEQSIPDQKKAIEGYAAEHSLRLGQFYVDDAISGTSTIGRRAFQRMMKEAQSPAKPFDLIVVYDVKRFGRVDNDEAGYYRQPVSAARAGVGTRTGWDASGRERRSNVIAGSPEQVSPRCRMWLRLARLKATVAFVRGCGPWPCAHEWAGGGARR